MAYTSIQSRDKVYVTVRTDFLADGTIIPRMLRWEDGTRYVIDEIINVTQTAAQKVGGCGDRYTVRIMGRECNLFFERNASLRGANIGRWFVERKA